MPAGRPLELTPQMVAEAERLIPLTLYIETVADLLGVHRVTFRRWVKAGAVEQRKRDRGREPNPKYDLHRQLCIAIKKALGKTESDHLQQIQAAGTESWQAMAWVLERRFLGKWSLNRAEVRELKRRLDELERASGKPQQPAPATGTRVRAAVARSIVE